MEEWFDNGDLYPIKKGESEFVRHHAVESLNFQLSVTIYFIVSGILVFLLVGIPLLIAVAFFDLVLIIVASVKASDGEYYTYPLCIRFVK